MKNSEKEKKPSKAYVDVFGHPSNMLYSHQGKWLCEKCWDLILDGKELPYGKSD